MENKSEKEFADKHLSEMLKFVDDIVTSTTEQYPLAIIIMEPKALWEIPAMQS